MTLVSTVGGASGPLYGTLFLRMSASAGDHASLDAAAWGAALQAGLGGVVARGRAEAGDKTMYDALAPACAAYDEAVARGAPIGEALAKASAGSRCGSRLDDSDAGAQGAGVLPRRAQHRAPGSRRDLDGPADRHGRPHPRLSGGGPR